MCLLPFPAWLCLGKKNVKEKIPKNNINYDKTGTQCCVEIEPRKIKNEKKIMSYFVHSKYNNIIFRPRFRFISGYFILLFDNSITNSGVAIRFRNFNSLVSSKSRALFDIWVKKKIIFLYTRVCSMHDTFMLLY